MLLNIKRYIDKVTGAMSAVSYIGVSVIVLLTVVDVVLTKVFAKPIVGSYEITEQLLLITVYASFAYGQSQKSHINMALVLARLPRALRFICYSLMCALSVGIAGLLGYAGILQAIKNYETGVVTANLYIPTFPFIIVVAIAMFVFAIALLYDLVLSLAAIKNDECAEMVTSGWSS